MKYLLLVTIITILSAFVFSQNANALDIILDSYRNSDLILVGKVISLSQVPSTHPIQQPNQTQYDIQVEKYYKNQQSAKLVSVYGYGKGLYLLYDPTYNVGDRLYLFLKKEQGRYVIQDPSFTLYNNCNADMILPSNVVEIPEKMPRGFPVNNMLYVSGFHENGNFKAGDTVRINYSAENYFPLKTNAIIELNVADQDGNIVLYDKKIITLSPCNDQVPLSWDLVTEKIGNYSAKVKVVKHYEMFLENFFSREEPIYEYGIVVEPSEPMVSADKPIDSMLAPLKQFKSGIPVDKIICKDGLVFAQKGGTGNPICVKPETKKKLDERNLIEQPSPFSPYPDHN